MLLARIDVKIGPHVGFGTTPKRADAAKFPIAVAEPISKPRKEGRHLRAAT
jgi:hypothetical protein